MKMITNKNILRAFCCVIVMSLAWVVGSAAEEADMQEKYGYYLMDVPNEAKQAYYDKNTKKWEDSIYSERMLFLREWEVEKKQEELRKQRMQRELGQQKKEEDLKQKERDMEKEQKLREKQIADRQKETKEKQEKRRIGQKHKSVFKKMDDLKNKQKERANENRN
jgi:hypothetical protein